MEQAVITTTATFLADIFLSYGELLPSLEDKIGWILSFGGFKILSPLSLTVIVYDADTIL